MPRDTTLKDKNGRKLYDGDKVYVDHPMVQGFFYIYWDVWMWNLRKKATDGSYSNFYCPQFDAPCYAFSEVHPRHIEFVPS